MIINIAWLTCASISYQDNYKHLREQKCYELLCCVAEGVLLHLRIILAALQIEKETKPTLHLKSTNTICCIILSNDTKNLNKGKIAFILFRKLNINVYIDIYSKICCH